MMNIFITEVCLSPLIIMQLLITAFLAVLFLQSGIDKFIDWKGNYSWLNGHFANSPLKNIVPFLLGTVSVFEVASGALCLAGFVELIITGGWVFSFYGILFSAITILCLFFGQRIAKDYAGAASLVGYFILTMIGLYIFI